VATINPETRRRVAYDALAGVGSTAGLPKPEIKRPKVASAPKAPVAPAAPTTAIQPIDIPDPRQRLANILNVDPANLGRITPGVVGRPVSETSVRWAEQAHIKANTPWYVNAITKGPVGGFLNAIQKPLAFTTSALKETIDVFTGENASWGDFKKQYDDNYTFGRLLHDYDLLQDRDSGWQKFAAAAIGFTGDVALDPLSYLGLVGKGIGFGAKLTTKAAGNITREVARKGIMGQLRNLGGDAMSVVGKNMKQGDWQALADDLGQAAAAGGKKGTAKAAVVDLGNQGWEITFRAGPGVPSHKVVLSNAEVGDLTKMNDLIGRAMKDGATSVAGDDLRFAARMMADSGLDRNLRHGADEFLDSAGRGIREQVAESGLDETVETTIKKFTGRSEVSGNKWINGKFEPMARRNIGWLSPEDAAKMKLGFGMKMPGTGPIGRKLGIAKKIDDLSLKIFKKGYDSPYGLRLLSSEAPVIGKLVTGIPQGIRNGILRQAAQAAGAKKIPDALRRGGLFRLAGKPFGKEGKLSGKLADLKNVVRESSDGVLIQQGKRVIHAMSRGKNVGRRLKVQMTARVRAYMDEVDAAAIDNDAVSRKTIYSALGGNEDAISEITAVAPDLVTNGRELMEDLRTMANTTSGREGGFLGLVNNYVPRALTGEARDKVRAALANRGRDTPRFRSTAGQPKGPELGRSYISKQDFEKRVEDYLAKNPLVDRKEAERFIRSGEGSPDARAIQSDFWGTELLEPGSETGMFDPRTGQEIMAPSIEDQIADILVASGADYMLFTDDLQVALDGYVRQVSHRAGEVYAENVLFNEGVLQQSIAQYIKLPDAAAVKTARDIQKALDGLQRATADLNIAIRESADPATDLARNRQQQDKLNEIIKQKSEELERLNVHQDDLLQRHVEAHDRFAKNRKELREVNDEMRQLEAEIERTPAGPRLVALEKQRIRLNNALAALAEDAPTLRFAYETLTSGTIHVMKLERQVAGIFGTPEAFEAFVGNDLLRGLNHSDIDGGLRELAAAGNLPDSVIQLPDGRWAFQTPEGKSLEMDRLFADLNGVLERLDREGMGAWVGVEAELNVFDHLANDAAKIDFALRRIHKDIDEMTEVIGEYSEIAPEILAPDGGGVVPTPDAVVAAKQTILDAVDGADLPEAVFADPAINEALMTYYGGSAMPVSQFIQSGSELDGMLSQIRSTLEDSIDGVNTNLEIIQQVAEDSGQPVRLRVVREDGSEVLLSVADYVQMEQQYRALEQYRSTLASPIDDTRPSIEDILSGEQLSDQMGSNVGGLFRYGGKKYYVKRYDDVTAGGDRMPPGTGRRRLTGEVLGNALYRELGLAVPDSYASRNMADDSLWHVAPWIEDIETVASFRQMTGTEPLDTVIFTDGNGFQRLGTAAEAAEWGAEGVVPLATALTRGLAADLLLANWDVVGTGFDNIGVSPLHGLVRIDQGSSFFYRAQGAAKADLGWEWGAMSDMSRSGGMLDPETNAMFAPLALAGVPEDELMGELARQVQALVDLRLEAGGMTNFVRRMMPTPNEALDDLAPFADFLEKRLEVLAERFGIDWASVDDADWAQRVLAKRGFSEEVIRQSGEAGTLMKLFHFTKHSPPLSLTSSYGVRGTGWHDTAFLNSTPSNMFYTHSGMEYGYNLLVDLPLGVRSLKMYGLKPGADELDAAQRVLDLGEAGSPDILEDLVARATGRHGSWQGHADAAAGDLYLDQFSRVFASDPRLVRQMRGIMEAWGPTLAWWPTAPSTDFVQVMEAMRYADELADVRVPTDISNWNTDSAAAAIMVDKAANASYRDRIEYALWRQFSEEYDIAATHGESAYSSGPGSIEEPLEDLAQDFARFLYAKDPEFSQAFVAGDPFIDRVNRNQKKFGTAINAAFTGIPDRLDPTNKRLAEGAFGWDGLLESPATGGRGGRHKQIVEGSGGPKEEAMRRWYLSQFHHAYQNSMSADGYTAAAWINKDDVVQIHGSQAVRSHRGFPNFMAVNPAAMRSADVKMTHRNISRIAEEGKPRPMDAVDPRAQSRMDQNLGVHDVDPDYVPTDADFDQLADDLAWTGEEPVGARPFDDVFEDDLHPFWEHEAPVDSGWGATTQSMRDHARDMEEAALGKGASPEEAMREAKEMLEDAYFNDWLPLHADDFELEDLATASDGFDEYFRESSKWQAERGETLFIEPAAFFEWFQAVSDKPQTIYGGSADPSSVSALEALVERRAQLVADQQAAALAYRESSRKMKSVMDFDAEKAKIELSTPPDSWVASLRDTEKWLVDKGMTEKQAQIDEVLDTLARLGAPVEVPLENLPDDLIDLRLAVGALVEGDNAMLNFALDEFQRNAEGWTDLISNLPDQKLGDLHKIPQAEEIMEDVFLSGFKEFGRLQGNSTLVDSLMASETFRARGGAAGFLNKYDKLHNLLRAYMIAKPGFHGRNFLSGAFMNHLAGIDWRSYRRFMRAYWKFQEEEAAAAGLPKRAARMRKAMRGRFISPENVNVADVEIVRELARTGSLGSGGGQVATEFVESSGRGILASRLAPNTNIRIGGKEVNVVDAINPMNTRNAPLRLSKNFGMATETFLRGSLGFDTLAKGGNASEAFDNIMKFHFDYEDLSDFERNVVKRVVPFYTWTRKNLPLMMEQFARRPEVFNRWMSLKKEIELMSEDDEGGIVPRWMQRQGAIRLPFKYEGENMMILPDLPFKAPLELIDPAMAFDRDLGFMERAEIALGSIGTQITPLIKAPYEWKAKQNLWKGYSYDGRAEAVPGAYTMIPGMMQLLSIAGVAKKNERGDWTMPDHALHAMAQLLPTFTDHRRLFPDEEKYQQRSLSNWISWFSGIGLRTNTKWEQHMEMLSRSYDMREERNQLRALRGAQL